MEMWSHTIVAQAIQKKHTNITHTVMFPMAAQRHASNVYYTKRSQPNKRRLDVVGRIDMLTCRIGKHM